MMVFLEKNGSSFNHLVAPNLPTNRTGHSGSGQRYTAHTTELQADAHAADWGEPFSPVRHMSVARCPKGTGVRIANSRERFPRKR